MKPLLVFIAMLLWLESACALNDFQTDRPQLIVRLKDPKKEIPPEVQKKMDDATDLIHQYYRDWQGKFGTIRRHLKINLIPVDRQIPISGGWAEGVWSWTSFDNEEGSAVLGVSGDLYVNINSAYISQEALIAHESSHAFLLTYYPKLLEGWKNFAVFNEGLAELFAVEYEPKPWKNWNKMLMAQRARETVNYRDLSAYGVRLTNVLKGRTNSQHDIGFFFFYVVRNGRVDLDKNLKTDNNAQILAEVKEWLKKNEGSFDLRAVAE